MPVLTLKRALQTDSFTTGYFAPDPLLGHPEFFTLELPWRRNQINISCIPAGIYRLTKRQSPRFGKCIRVENVPGRAGILIHAGNTTRDTHGCILPGTIGKIVELSKGKREPRVFNSRLALSNLINHLDNDNSLTDGKWVLQVIDPYERDHEDRPEEDSRRRREEALRTRRQAEKQEASQPQEESAARGAAPDVKED
jgi:hypothetical protein